MTKKLTKQSIGVGVAGTGFIGPAHVEGLRRNGIQVLGLAEETREKAQQKAAEMGIPRVYDSYEAMLADPDIDRYADAVSAFMAKRGLDRPVLLGHSLGGAVAISLAARHPDLLRGLLLVDSAPPSGLKTPSERYPFIEAMRANRAVLRQALHAVAPTMEDTAFLERLVDDASKMAPAAWVGNAEALGRFDYRGRCGSFTDPVLVVWGRRDVLVTEAMAAETAAAFPGARLEILENVGHSVMVEDPPRFAALVSGFVQWRAHR